MSESNVICLSTRGNTSTTIGTGGSIKGVSSTKGTVPIKVVSSTKGTVSNKGVSRQRVDSR